VVFLPCALKAAGVLDSEEAWLLESYLIERGEATVPLGRWRRAAGAYLRT